MRTCYDDITSRLGDPLWWDVHGVPRYEPFEPGLCGIYNDTVILTLVQCQSCRKEYKVALEYSKFDSYMPPDSFPTPAAPWNYGDPPPHDCTGSTECVIPVRILEFWRRVRDGIGLEWKRYSEYEFEYDQHDDY